jgi:hypothetical protein
MQTWGFVAQWRRVYSLYCEDDDDFTIVATDTVMETAEETTETAPLTTTTAAAITNPSTGVTRVTKRRISLPGIDGFIV